MSFAQGLGIIGRLFFLIVLLNWPLRSSAFAGPQFQIDYSTTGGNCESCEWISLTGEIPEDADVQLLTFLVKQFGGVNTKTGQAIQPYPSITTDEEILGEAEKLKTNKTATQYGLDPTQFIAEIRSTLRDYESIEDIRDYRPDVFLRVELSSTGGSVTGAMALGRLLRKAVAKVSVSDNQFRYNEEIGLSEPERGYPRPAVCYSACVLAFLGGVIREFGQPGQPEPKMGVHQLTDALVSVAENTQAFTGNDIVQRTKINAELVAYFKEMGVDAELIGLMSSTPPNQMRILSSVELNALRILQPYPSLEPWTVFINGETISARSSDKNNMVVVTISCGPGKKFIATIDASNDFLRFSELFSEYPLLVMGEKIEVGRVKWDVQQTGRTIISSPLSNLKPFTQSPTAIPSFDSKDIEAMSKASEEYSRLSDSGAWFGDVLQIADAGRASVWSLATINPLLYPQSIRMVEKNCNG
jgi:hypothetical protein